MDYLGFPRSRVCSKEDGCCEDPSESAGQSAMFGTFHLRSEGSRAFRCHDEIERSDFLLPGKCQPRNW